MGAFAAHLVGFLRHIEAKELFTEVAFVELVAKYCLIGGLELGQGEVLRQKRVDGVGVGELGNQPFTRVGDDTLVVIGEWWEVVYREEAYDTVCLVWAQLTATSHIGDRDGMSAGVTSNGVKGVELFKIAEVVIDVEAGLILHNTLQGLGCCFPLWAVAARQRPAPLEWVLVALNKTDVEYAIDDLEHDCVNGKRWGYIWSRVVHTISIPHCPCSGSYSA